MKRGEKTMKKTFLTVAINTGQAGSIFANEDIASAIGRTIISYLLFPVFAA
jgi:hypothetical protein